MAHRVLGAFPAPHIVVIAADQEDRVIRSCAQHHPAHQHHGLRRDAHAQFQEPCDELLRHGLAAMVDRLCDGAASPLVHALVQGRQFSPEDIAHFRRLLDELAAKE